MRELDMQGRRIVVRRGLGNNTTTLQELNDEYGLAAKRVRQIKKSAIGKFRGVMSHSIDS